jgi:hypothetical protein
MTWNIDRLKRAGFLLTESNISNAQEIEEFLSNCESTVATEDKLHTITEKFSIAELQPQISKMHRSDYLFTSIIQNMYATVSALPCVYVQRDIVPTKLRNFKAILHLDRYINDSYDEATVKGTIELLSEYLGYELKLFIGHECVLNKTPIYIDSPLIPTVGEDNIITFSFTYSTPV